jgi:hypothetical protein
MLLRVNRSPDAAEHRGSLRLTHVAVTLVAGLALALAACSPNNNSARGSAGSSEVTVLQGISSLQERFKQDSGKVRLILLVSPT